MFISCVNQSNENDDQKDKIIGDSSFMDGADLSYVTIKFFIDWSRSIKLMKWKTVRQPIKT